MQQEIEKQKTEMCQFIQIIERNKKSIIGHLQFNIIFLAA